MEREFRIVDSSVGRSSFVVAHPRVGTCWQGVVLVAGGWAGVALANVAAGTSSDPSSGSAVLLTGVLAIVSLLAIVAGVVVAVSAVLSPMRYVFRLGPTARSAALLLVGGAVATVLWLQRGPFRGMVSHGRPFPDLIVDLVWLAGSVVCVLAGFVAVHGAIRARQDERTRAP